MARPPPKLTKTVSEKNLALLGEQRLAGLLMLAAAGDPGFKRRLRLELAAELGAADLAAELDRRLDTLREGRGRISWRKRPALVRELSGLRDLIVDRLTDQDAALALDRLIAWFDLADPLAGRVKDSRGELTEMFEGAAPEIARIADRVGVEGAAPRLHSALDMRAAIWAPVLGRAAPVMSQALAGRLAALLRPGLETASARRRLVARRLSDRAGDIDVWLETLTAEERRSSGLGAEAARRLARDGRPAQARAALEATRPPVSRVVRGRKERRDPAPDERWRSVEIAVLDAEGRTKEALEARWLQFERTLSPEVLRELVGRLDDFEDVVAIDRALAFAQTYFDLMQGVSFLMDWGAMREAAEAVLARPEDVRGDVESIPLWASRLAGRHPEAAALLLRAHVRALVAQGHGGDQLAGVLAELDALAARADRATANRPA